MSIIERLRELEKDATGPKWVVGFSDGSGERWLRTDEDSIIVISGVEDSWGLPQGVLSPADAALIAEARNHLSALLDVAEAARALLESAEGYATEAKARGVWNDKDADCLIVAGIIAKLQPALARLEGGTP